MLRYLSSGESHGPCLTAIIEGLPAGLYITSEFINKHLSRRQRGYGRGERMSIEEDRVNILSGLRFNETIGSPLTVQIMNRDNKNWHEVMAVEGERAPGVKSVTSPRPGHGDFAGGVKYLRDDLRDILERSSARETAVRTAVGSVAACLLQELGIKVFSHVISIGNVKAGYEVLTDGLSLKVSPGRRYEEGDDKYGSGQIPDLVSKIESSPLRCCDYRAEALMIKAIDEARRQGDTLGGIFEVIVTGVPPGLGSHVFPDRRLDGRLAGAMMSLQGIKGVETGLGFQAAELPGSQVHDPFYYHDNNDHKKDNGNAGAADLDNNHKKVLCRSSNHAGGTEGGISNGMPLVIRAAMKPIPTLLKPLPGVDLHSRKETKAAVERSDVCAVPSASIVGEAVVAWEIAAAVMEKFGGDSMEELITSYDNYLEMINMYLKGEKN